MPETYAVLTTEPNDLIRPIHNRMPVILTAETMARWIGDQPLAEDEFKALTQPLPADRMAVRPVSRFVNNVRNEGPQCIAAPDDPPPELTLDLA